MESSEAAVVINEAKRQQEPSSRGRTRGGWITFPLMIGTMAGLSLSAGGWISNLIVYLIEEYNVKSISAAKAYNFVNGSITMLPIVGAVLADSFFGCFSVIWFSSLISLLGVGILVLTASADRLRPQACNNHNGSSSSCEHPSHLQLGVLYLGLALASLGNAGTRFTVAPFGADQFDSPKHQGTFFNWYIFTMYSASIVSSTAIVYVEDNLSWALGFSLCAAANVVGLAVFLSGTRFYRRVKPMGSPFTSLARVIVASFRKRRMSLSDKHEDYYFHDGDDHGVVRSTRFLRFLNRAALLETEKDSKSDHPTAANKIAGPWTVCTVRQVEDLKSLVKILPLWSTGLLLCIPLAIQLSMSVIQALAMDRRMGPRVKIPAGTIPVFILISTCTFILVVDRLLFPLYEKMTKTPLAPLRRIGIGHALTVLSMALSALVERKRLEAAHDPAGRVAGPVSVFWLVPPLAIAGMGEAFHFPGQVAFYYREFPEALKITSTAAVAMFIGIAFYASNAVIDAVQRVTGWLPDDIDEGRLDNVYWLCCALVGLNFAYYVVCAAFYKYKDDDAKDADGI